MSQFLTSLSEKLIRVLPPAFVLLLIMNIVFLATAAWVFQHNTTARNDLLNKIITDCLLEKKAP